MMTETWNTVSSNRTLKKGSHQIEQKTNFKPNCTENRLPVLAPLSRLELLWYP